MPRLEFELIPKALWGQSLAQKYRPQWDKLRKVCYQKAGHRCEICSGKGERWPVEAHEIWEYEYHDDGTAIQRLVRLIALCPDCHAAKHMGRTLGLPLMYQEKVKEHLCEVNGWTRDQLRDAYNAAYERWELDNTLEWSQDLTAFLGQAA